MISMEWVGRGVFVKLRIPYKSKELTTFVLLCIAFPNANRHWIHSPPKPLSYHRKTDNSGFFADLPGSD